MKPQLYIITVLFLLLFSARSSASSVQRRTIKSGMSRIEKKYGYGFLYGGKVRKMLDGRYEDADISGMKMTEALKSVFSAGNIRWTVYENARTIVLTAPETSSASAENGSFCVTGQVTDASTGESLPGAGVVFSDGTGAYSDTLGRYSHKICGGKTRLLFSYIGYKTLTCDMYIDRDVSIDIALRPDLKIKSSKVSSNMAGHADTVRAECVVTPSEFLCAGEAAVLGETDIMKRLYTFPGVHGGTTGISGIYVRGNGPDENLVMVDGVPIYAPEHMFGLVSAFTPENMDNMTLYKGAVPAEYGGRLSGVINVDTSDGDMTSVKGCASVGLVSGNIHVDGPLCKEKASLSFGARMSHTLLFDKLLDIAGLNLNSGFADVSLKVAYRLNWRDSISVLSYAGYDRFWNREGKDADSQNYNAQWGNALLSFRWRHEFDCGMISDMSASFNGYRVRTKSDALEIFSRPSPDYGTSTFDRKSELGDARIRAGFRYSAGSAHRLSFGTELVRHSSLPDKMQARIYTETGASYSCWPGYRIRSGEISIYAEDNINVMDRASLSAGLRLNLLHTDSHLYLIPEPRFSARFALCHGLSLDASYSRMSQSVHRLISGTLSIPTEIWFPVTGRIRPAVSDICSVGSSYDGIPGWKFSAEVYYKRMANVAEPKYVNGAWASLAGGNLENNIITGKGRAYGMELYAGKTAGKLTASASYTLSWSERKFPGSQVNDGKWFPYTYDRRHNMRIEGTWRINGSIGISADWVYMSGSYFTVPSMRALRVAPDGKFFCEPDAGERNNYHLRPTHHLDVSVNLYRQKRHGNRTISLGMYNVYGAQNPDWVILKGDYEYHEGGKRIEHVYVSCRTFLAFVPTFNYTFRF